MFEAVEDDLLANTDGGDASDAIGRLRAGLMGFLNASLTREVLQVLLIDGPAVLGWQEWRELEARYGLGVIRGHRYRLMLGCPAFGWSVEVPDDRGRVDPGASGSAVVIGESDERLEVPAFGGVEDEFCDRRG